MARAARQMRAGDYGGAATSFQRALDKRPGHVESLIGLGDALLADGKPRSARRVYRRALRLSPDNPCLRGQLRTRSAGAERCGVYDVGSERALR